MRILVVDDDPAVGRLTAGMLEGAGHQAVTVADPESALQHLSAGEQFDLVLSDVIMPGGMDGMDFVREVKRRWANLPVLLVTGYAGDINAIQRHFPVLHKPFTAVELMLAMKALLQQTSSARHPRS
jgi:CheY-like chemotaxis protein